MDDIFTKFYSNYIEEIHNFLNSSANILYISGYSGSGKSSVVKKSLNTYGGDILKFHHLCFKNTVIDDFLLSFYDTFRKYTVKGQINLKKNPETDFMQKVSFYFGNLEYKTAVLIDNFEIVDNNTEIADFLTHISKFENVKVIVISKNQSCLLTENSTVAIERLDFQKINLFEFDDVLGKLFYDMPKEVIEKFYDACEGYELYLKMALTYLSSVNISLETFMGEFELKNIPFEDFMIERQISLIPETYYPVLENMACIHHNISPKFIEAYNLGNIKFFPYLMSKFAISEYFGTYYLKTYLRKYFIEGLSLQKKINIYSKIISIYENELKKSPKDRILRLSRESIRNLIEDSKKDLPKVQKINPAPSFNYVTQAIAGNPNWFVTGNSNKNMLGKKIPEKPKPETPEKEKFTAPPSLFDKLLSQALSFEKDYRYKEALEILNDAKIKARTLEDKISVYSKIAFCYTKLNDNNAALVALRELCKLCLEENDINSYARYKIEAGKIYKKTYALSRAKACFEEVKEKKELIKEKTLALANIALGEIYELENSLNKAIEEYKEAYNLILNSSGEKDVLLPEIAYKTGSMYDENGYFEEALLEYEKSINCAKLSGNNLYLTKCHTNSGLIQADFGNYTEAVSHLNIAFELSKETENYLDTYYIARNTADIYKTVNPDKAYEFLNVALEYARLSENSFEIATALIELGDYYYDLKQNEQALICYFQAKTTLGSSASKENLLRVTTRINDMKIKLGEYIFKGMKELYDPD